MPSINLLGVISDNPVWLVSVELSVSEHLLGWKPINKPNKSVYISHSRATCFYDRVFLRLLSLKFLFLLNSILPSLFFSLANLFFEPTAQYLHYSSCWFLTNLLAGFHHLSAYNDNLHQHINLPVIKLFRNHLF